MKKELDIEKEIDKLRESMAEKKEEIESEIVPGAYFYDVEKVESLKKEINEMQHKCDELDAIPTREKIEGEKRFLNKELENVNEELKEYQQGGIYFQTEEMKELEDRKKELKEEIAKKDEILNVINEIEKVEIELEDLKEEKKEYIGAYFIPDEILDGIKEKEEKLDELNKKIEEYAKERIGKTFKRIEEKKEETKDIENEEEPKKKTEEETKKKAEQEPNKKTDKEKEQEQEQKKDDSESKKEIENGEKEQENKTTQSSKGSFLNSIRNAVNNIVTRIKNWRQKRLDTKNEKQQATSSTIQPKVERKVEQTVEKEEKSFEKVEKVEKVAKAEKEEKVEKEETEVQDENLTLQDVAKIARRKKEEKTIDDKEEEQDNSKEKEQSDDKEKNNIIKPEDISNIKVVIDKDKASMKVSLKDGRNFNITKNNIKMLSVPANQAVQGSYGSLEKAKNRYKNLCATYLRTIMEKELGIKFDQTFKLKEVPTDVELISDEILMEEWRKEQERIEKQQRETIIPGSRAKVSLDSQRETEKEENKDQPRMKSEEGKSKSKGFNKILEFMTSKDDDWDDEFDDEDEKDGDRHDDYDEHEEDEEKTLQEWAEIANKRKKENPFRSSMEDPEAAKKVVEVGKKHAEEDDKVPPTKGETPVGKKTTDYKGEEQE